MYRVQKLTAGAAKKIPLRAFHSAAIAAFLTGTLTGLSFSMPTKAQAEKPIRLIQTKNKSDIKVRINEVTLVTMNEKIADALIGNPAIADITIQSSSSFVITGKSYGNTNIILLNKAGKPIFNRTISVDDTSQNIVRIQKGTARVSYTCNPNCQPTPTLGDDREHLKMLSENYQDKMKEVGQALSLSNNGN